MDVALQNPNIEVPGAWRAGEPHRYFTPARQIWVLLNGHPWRTRSSTLAYVCACFSELAYLHLTDRELDQPGRYKWAPSLTFQALAAAGVRYDLRTAVMLDFPVFVFDTDNFVYAGFKVRDTAIVAIRGTKSGWDILVDLMAWKRADDATGRRVHFGFGREARLASPLLHEHLTRLGGVREVIFTGHSLGGALAGILHARWPALRTAFTSLTPYIFGAPRYAGAGSTRFTQTNAYRKPRDLVPHLPPRFLGYEDAGPSPVPVPDEPLDAWPSAWRVLAEWVPRPGGPPFAHAHAIELYRRQLGTGLAPDFPDLVYWEYAQAIMRSKSPPTYPEPR